MRYLDDIFLKEFRRFFKETLQGDYSTGYLDKVFWWNSWLRFFDQIFYRNFGDFSRRLFKEIVLFFVLFFLQCQSSAQSRFLYYWSTLLGGTHPTLSFLFFGNLHHCIGVLIPLWIMSLLIHRTAKQLNRTRDGCIRKFEQLVLHMTGTAEAAQQYPHPDCPLVTQSLLASTLMPCSCFTETSRHDTTWANRVGWHFLSEVHIVDGTTSMFLLNIFWSTLAPSFSLLPNELLPFRTLHYYWVAY